MRRLDRELTKEYWLARERVPDIVAIESDPLKYLRTDNGQVRNAATRVALYWKHRRRYFGPDRWLLPMTQTGTGCLSREDIHVLRSGYIVIVTLHSGQQVCMMDPSRLGGQDPGESRERCIFYLCTNEVNERSARSGLEIIFLLTKYGFASEGRHTEMIDVLYTGMPTKVRHLTIVQSIEEGRNELLDFLSFRLEKTYTIFTPTKVSVVKVDSRQTVLEALGRRGIHERYLPKQLGGDYDYSQLSEWVQTRLVVENAMWASLSHRKALPASFRQQGKQHHRFGKQGNDTRVVKKASGTSRLKMEREWSRPCITSMFWRDIELKQEESSNQSSPRRRSRRSKRNAAPLPEILLDKKERCQDLDNQRLEEILLDALNDSVH